MSELTADLTALMEAQFEYWWNSHPAPRPELSREVARAAWLTASSLALERQEAERDAFLETLATFHADPEHGQYDCIGYSEGQECCVEKLRALLAEPAGREEPSLGEIQRRGYRYGPGEPIPGDEADTAREW